MASHHRRRSSLEKASIESILKSGEPGQPAAAPSPHVGNSPGRAYFAMSPPPTRTAVNHSRALSYTSRRPNRLSLSFPVAPSTHSNESSRATPTSSKMPSFPPTPADIIPESTPEDPSGFLVALAGQERRVLELKEELAKAELELRALKRQWAYHESHKKKAEIRHVEPLQDFKTAGAAKVGSDEPSTRRSAEVDRRKALLNNLNIPKENRRKFSGAHTRTLSLLSPERSNFREPRNFVSLGETGPDSPSIPRTFTMPDTSQGITRISSAANRNRHSYQSGMTHGAKQIAEDVKAGLWTFLEDLRQATVGDEAINGTTSRASLEPGVGTPVRRGSKGSRGSLLGNERGKRNPSPQPSTSPRTWETLTGNPSLLDAAGSLWPDMDQPLQPSPAPKTTKKASKTISLAAPALDDLDDDWSNWDSPTPKSPRWSGSSTLSEDPATPSRGNVDDRNIKISDESSTPSKRDSIQWPALDKLTASNLKGGLQRTMSTIMTEWEKSITPPPEERRDPQQSEEAVQMHIHDQVSMMSR